MSTRINETWTDDFLRNLTVFRMVNEGPKGVSLGNTTQIRLCWSLFLSRSLTGLFTKCNHYLVMIWAARCENVWKLCVSSKLVCNEVVGVNARVFDMSFLFLPCLFRNTPQARMNMWSVCTHSSCVCLANLSHRVRNRKPSPSKPDSYVNAFVRFAPSRAMFWLSIECYGVYWNVNSVLFWLREM